MCGITGIIGPSNQTTLRQVNQMTKALRHRGPDSLAFKQSPYSTLGFTRLAIIDLSANGSQPMVSPDSRYQLVMNGEIYNYLELKKELSPYYQFRSATDTEVLLACLIKLGPDALSKINGMFSFCLFDTVTHQAFLARDRFGQKPLFYFLNGPHLFFASEIKAFLAAGFKFPSNLPVWLKYLNHGLYDDDEQTFFRGVLRLEAGHFLTFSPLTGKLNLTPYYDLRSRVAKIDLSFSEALSHLKEIIADSFLIHTRADVPYTISLSGGVDSSALLAGLTLAGKLNSSIRCFTVDFGDDLKESAWANQAARPYGLKTQITNIAPSDLVSLFSAHLWQQEAPLGGLMNLGQTLNFATVRQSGFKVILDGGGADEVFCGYKSFHHKYLLDKYLNQDHDFDFALTAYCQFWQEEKSAVLIKILSLANSVRTEIDSTFSTSASFLKPEFITDPPYPIPLKDISLLDLQINYLKYFKLNRGLRMKDRGSMSNSLELRSPFLDHRLVEFGLKLPLDFYFVHGRTKSIFRELFHDQMEEEVRTTQKRSLNAPQGKWLRLEPVKSFVKTIIESDRFAARGLFNIPKIISAYDSYCATPTQNSFFIWQWLNFELWHRLFAD